MVCNKTHTYSIISTVHASCVTAILNLSWKHSTRFIAAAFFFNRSNVSLMLQMYKRRWIVRLGLVYVYNICTLNMYFYNVTYIYSLLVSLLHNRTFAWWCINYSAFILLWILFLKRLHLLPTQIIILATLWDIWLACKNTRPTSKASLMSRIYFPR